MKQREIKGWQMFSDGHFELKKGEFMGIVDGTVFGMGNWRIMKGDETIEKCFQFPGIGGNNIELSTKAFVEKRLSILTSLNPSPNE